MHTLKLDQKDVFRYGKAQYWIGITLLSINSLIFICGAFLLHFTKWIVNKPIWIGSAATFVAFGVFYGAVLFAYWFVHRPIVLSNEGIYMLLFGREFRLIAWPDIISFKKRTTQLGLFSHKNTTYILTGHNNTIIIFDQNILKLEHIIEELKNRSPHLPIEL